MRISCEEPTILDPTTCAAPLLAINQEPPSPLVAPLDDIFCIATQVAYWANVKGTKYADEASISDALTQLLASTIRKGCSVGVWEYAPVNTIKINGVTLTLKVTLAPTSPGSSSLYALGGGLGLSASQAVVTAYRLEDFEEIALAEKRLSTQSPLDMRKLVKNLAKELANNLTH